VNASPAYNAVFWPGWRPKSSARRGTMRASHQDLVRAMAADQGNLSRSLANLEAKGRIRITLTHSGRAEAVDLTREGRNRVAPRTASCE
jgi:DNA-binding MarR family transcriptional regulator